MITKRYKSEYEAWKKHRIAEKHGFFQIWQDFREFLPQNQLTGGALRLYLFFGIVSNNWTGHSWHSVKRIAKELGCGERSVLKWARELSDAGLIYRSQKKLNGVAHTYLRPYGPRPDQVGGASINSDDSQSDET